MRLLLVKISSLGDVVHNLPVVSDIRAHFPEATIDWTVEEGFAEVARLHPAVRRVIPIAIRRWRRALASAATWREIAAFRNGLGQESYDLVLDTQGLLKSALITRVARGRRAGYAAEAAREPIAARFYDDTYAIPRNLHAVERNRWLAAAALGYEPDGPLDYGLNAEPLQAPWLPAAPFVVLLSATSRDDKLWPEPHWIELGNELARQGMRSVLPAGNAVERDRAARLAAAMPGAIAAPPMGLRDLARLFAGSSAVVGVDTGLTHLAAALGRPTVALFCASEPALTGVYAPGTARNLGERGATPAVEEVLAALDEMALA